MSVKERKLKSSEKRRLKQYEKETPKKDFTDRYGKKKGEDIYYATLTKMAKKGKKKLTKCFLPVEQRDILEYKYAPEKKSMLVMLKDPNIRVSRMSCRTS